MDYRSTVRLPSTSFPMRARLAEREPERLKAWEEMDAYRLLQERGKEEERELFILHDGPPYANGPIHIGHALNKILKDMVIRSKSMAGYRAPYVPGWDAHGLPVELQMSREGEARGNDDILSFRRACADYARRFLAVQRDEFKRLGIWGDWDNPYITLDPHYVSAQIELFGEMAKAGYIYKGLKPVYWCSHCETALAEAEIEYRDHRSPSIFVAFRVRDGKGVVSDDAALLIWTTTPWTLPANLAVAANPNLDYVEVDVDGRRYVLAEGLLLGAQSALDWPLPTVTKRMKGADLEGVVAMHPFFERESPIILGDHVTLEQGTGLVHTAPGHGLEDYEVGQKYGLEILAPVDEKGRMTQEAGKYAGLSLDEANQAIVADMRSDGSLLRVEEIEHSYPHCWRCQHPVAFRATEQWFASVDAFRDQALAAIKAVKWIPSWGEERINNMVAGRSDWCISRQRRWGVPIPIFYCRTCKEALIDDAAIDAVATLFRAEGSNAWYAKRAEEILPPGTTCAKCGANDFEKEQDIMDVWFDSGSSHRAVLESHPELRWPADMYLEGSDQHRGWFQSSLLTAVATRGAAPYREVLTHGFIVDGEGRKMSKSLGNTVAPDEVIAKYGADVLRLWASSAEYRGDIRVSEDILEQMAEVYRRIRNTCRFLLGNLHDFDAEVDRLPLSEMAAIDRYALDRAARLYERCVKAYEAYNFHVVHHLAHNFCAVDMGGFYLDAIKDRLYCDAPDSRSRRSAQTAMSHILVVLAKLIAPILAFTADEVWEHMPDGLKDVESVHFSRWDEAVGAWKDDALAAEWDNVLHVRKLVAKALEQARNERVIGASLEARVFFDGPRAKEAIAALGEQLNEALIVSEAGEASQDFIQSLPVIEREGDLAVGVDKAKGEKCERCWRFAPGVGAHEDHPSLCDRCADVVRSL